MIYLSLIQLSAFRSNWIRLKLSEEDLRTLEIQILMDPDGPPVMKGTGGLRKIRFAPSSSGRGKSGAIRVCYALFPEFALICLCSVFRKNVKANLSPVEAAEFKSLLKGFAQYLRQNYRSKGFTP